MSCLPSSVVYLLHAERGLHITGERYAQHYIGFSSDWRSLHFRLDHHRAGCGSRLVRAWNLEGIDWTLVRLWDHGTRAFERQLKNRSCAPRLCPVCAVERSAGRYRTCWPPDRPERATRRELEVVRAGLTWHRRNQAGLRLAAESLVEQLAPATWTRDPGPWGPAPSPATASSA